MTTLILTRNVTMNNGWEFPAGTPVELVDDMGRSLAVKVNGELVVVSASDARPQ